MNRLIPHACSPFPFPTLTNKTHFFLLFLPKPNPSHSHTHRISFSRRRFMTDRDNPDMKEFMCYMESLKNNYEKSGVPKGAGTDSDDGFDLSRMKTLLGLLGNPHHNFKAVHIAGTKGKGSTAAFVSNILRAQGYSVGCYSSPHVQTIRERMSLGRSGDPVSARVLNGLFLSIRTVLDQAMQLEKGSISHFEVLTAMAFALFARENVDIAVVEAGLGGARDATNIIDSSGLAAAVITTIGEEHMAALGGSLESIAVAKSGIIKQGCPVVLGGPFLPHINHILHDKASMMNAPVIYVSDAVNRSTIKGLRDISGKPCQCCDIDIQTKGDFQLIYKLSNVNLRLIGSHQLQNAATATCTALCLRELGWRISDDSIKAGLKQTYLIGRSQFLTSKETESLGLPGARILLDGAHTKDSAKALIDTIQMTYPETQIALVVAMASDKDHLAFAKEFLSGTQLKAVILTEASIAGGKSRTTPATSLKDCWIQGSKELGISVVKDEVVNYHGEPLDGPIITTESSAETSLGIANRLIQHKLANRTGLIVVTGSLHIVSAILASLDV